MADYFAGDGTVAELGRWRYRAAASVGEPELDVPTLGDRAINLNTTWEFLKPIKVGDRLWSPAGDRRRLHEADPAGPEGGLGGERDAASTTRTTSSWQSAGTPACATAAPEEVAADPDTAKA